MREKHVREKHVRDKHVSTKQQRARLAICTQHLHEGYGLITYLFSGHFYNSSRAAFRIELKKGKKLYFVNRGGGGWQRNFVTGAAY